MNHLKIREIFRKTALFFCVAILWTVASASAEDLSDYKVVVLPFYQEQNAVVDMEITGSDYRRILRLVNGQLLKNGITVVDAAMNDLTNAYYDKLMERPRQDSKLTAGELCRKYDADAYFLVWLDLRLEETPDGYFKAYATLESEGAASNGYLLGTGFEISIIKSRKDRQRAILAVEKAASEAVGKAISRSFTDGEIGDSLNRLSRIVQIRLDGIDSYPATEAFAKVLKTATGVIRARETSGEIKLGYSQASYQTWEVYTAKGTDLGVLKANIMTMLGKVVKAGGVLELRGVKYRYTSDEIETLKEVYPKSHSTGQILFAAGI